MPDATEQRTSALNGEAQKTFACRYCGTSGFARYAIPTHVKTCPKAVKARRKKADAVRKREERARQGLPRIGRPPKASPKAKAKAKPVAPVPTEVRAFVCCPYCGLNLRQAAIAVAMQGGV